MVTYKVIFYNNKQHMTRNIIFSVGKWTEELMEAYVLSRSYIGCKNNKASVLEDKEGYKNSYYAAK